MTTDVTNAAALADSIRSVGLKVTEPRVAVLDVIEREPHIDAERIFQSIRGSLPGTSVQAVHGVLAAFSQAGLLRRIEPAHSPALYERRVDDNHHHIVCSGCGAVEDVDCAVGHSPCLVPSSASGFQVHSAEVNFWGLCPNCQTA